MRRALIPRSSELRGSLPLKGDATPVRPAQSGLEDPLQVRGDMRREGRDMARKTSGKRGSAIIVLMIVGAIAASPSTAAAAKTPQPSVSVPAAVPVLAVQAPVLGLDLASWAEASWAEE